MIAEYGMFTRDGNEACGRIVNAICQMPAESTNEQMYARLKDLLAIAQLMYPEIYDTDVREHMIAAIEKRTGREMTIYF